MIEVKHYLRKAYLQKFASLTYQGKAIPMDDENLTKPPAVFNYGNIPVEAYVLIQNQTLQDASPKCAVNQNTQLQLDVTTVFPTGTTNNGGYMLADQISDVILQELFPGAINQIDLPFPEAQLWNGYLVSSQHLFSEFEASRVYRNILILNHSIKQNQLTT